MGLLNIFKKPNIIKETTDGFFSQSLEDDMLSNREIECIGMITAESVNSLINQIRYLAKQDLKKEITIYINSPGGEVPSGLALYDVMKAVECPIRTVCIGMAASMGAILFASGDKREILPHARVMIHDPLIAGGIGGNALAVKSIADDLMRTREITCKILAEHTHRSIEEIYEQTKTDNFFYAEEAVEFGLADKIITQL